MHCKNISDINRYLQQCIKLSFTSYDVHIADLDYIAYTYCQRRHITYDKDFKLQVLAKCTLHPGHIGPLCVRWDMTEDEIRANCKCIK